MGQSTVGLMTSQTEHGSPSILCACFAGLLRTIQSLRSFRGNHCLFQVLSEFLALCLVREDAHHNIFTRIATTSHLHDILLFMVRPGLTKPSSTHANCLCVSSIAGRIHFHGASNSKIYRHSLLITLPGESRKSMVPRARFCASTIAILP